MTELEEVRASGKMSERVLENSVRYLKRYADDLEKQGFSISGILAESKNLSDMNWLSVLNY